MFYFLLLATFLLAAGTAGGEKLSANKIIHHTSPPRVTVPFVAPTMLPMNKLAHNCESAMGDVVTNCEKKAMTKYDPDHLNISASTTWETCCGVYMQLDCIKRSAVIMCPKATYDGFILYSFHMINFLKTTVCPKISYSNWKPMCDKDMSNAMVNRTIHNHRGKNDNKVVNLPSPTGPEKVCFKKLDKTKEVDKCLNKSVNIWNPDTKNLWDKADKDTCCAFYLTMDCVVEKAGTVCAKGEQSDMNNYKMSAMNIISSTICKKMPYSIDQKHQCDARYTKGASFDIHQGSMATIIGSLMLWIMMFY